MATSTFAEDRRDHALHGVTANSEQERQAARSACVRYARSHGLDRADVVELWLALGIVPEQGGAA